MAATRQNQEATSYGLLPIAAVHSSLSTPIHALGATSNARWLFTGADDGFIRKWDLKATIATGNRLSQSAMAGLFESISKGGILESAWENEELPVDYKPTRNLHAEYRKFLRDSKDPQFNLSSVRQELDATQANRSLWSPVYSLGVQSEGEWCLAGCKSGNVNLYTVRYDEGICQYVFRGHNSTVSCIAIDHGETSFLSGSWDRTIISWDLETGNQQKRYEGFTSQLTCIQFRSADNAFQRMENPDSVATNTVDSAVFLATSYDGRLYIFDQRSPSLDPTTSIGVKSTGSPPWSISAAWSKDGGKIYVGRRNSAVDEYDVRANRFTRSFKLSQDSGPISAVCPLENGRTLICCSFDNIRAWDLGSKELSNPNSAFVKIYSTDNNADELNTKEQANELENKDTTQTQKAQENGTEAISELAGKQIEHPVASDPTKTEGHSEQTNSVNSAKEGPIIESNNTVANDQTNDKIADSIDTSAPVVPFSIIPGHRSGTISAVLVDSSCRFMVSSSGTRGWDGVSTDQCLLYDITHNIST